MQRLFREPPTTLEIVERTRAIRWWIDEQIAKGRSNEEIEMTLPLAVEVISGRVSIEEVRQRIAEVRRGVEGEVIPG